MMTGVGTAVRTGCPASPSRAGVGARLRLRSFRPALRELKAVGVALTALAILGLKPEALTRFVDLAMW